MKEKTPEIVEAYPEGSFKRLFWEEQLRAASKKDMRQVRWHPLIIRWCLNLKLLSSSAYHAVRTAGFISLPSERTLRDYSNAKLAFSWRLTSNFTKKLKLLNCKNRESFV